MTMGRHCVETICDCFSIRGTEAEKTRSQTRGREFSFGRMAASWSDMLGRETLTGWGEVRSSAAGDEEGAGGATAGHTAGRRAQDRDGQSQE